MQNTNTPVPSQTLPVTTNNPVDNTLNIQSLLASTFREQLASDVGLDDIKTSEIKAGLDDIVGNTVSEDRKILIAHDIAFRISAERETIIKLVNPQSTYEPDWLEGDDIEEKISSMYDRDDYQEFINGITRQLENVSDDNKERVKNFISNVIEADIQEIEEFYENDD